MPTPLHALTDQHSKALIRRLVRDYARPYLGTIVWGLIAMAIVAAMSVASAKLTEPIMNELFGARNRAMLIPITASIFAVFLIKGIANYAETVAMAYVGQRIIADIQRQLFAHVIQEDLAFFHNTPTGELVSRFMNDVTKLHSAVTGTLTNIGKDSLTLIAFIIFMFYQDWFMASIAFLVVPIAVLPVVRIGKRMRKVSTNIQEETALFTILLTQAFQGIRLVKAYCMEGYEQTRVHKTIEAIFKKMMRGSRVKAASHPIMEFLGGVAIALIILYGGTQVIEGHQSAGTFFSFITALLMTYEPLKRLANLNANLQEQLAAAGRVFEYLDHPPRVVDCANAQPLSHPAGVITFRDVSFAYDPDTPILKGVTLEIPAGKTVALVGASGSGKSTIMNLVPRFYDLAGGEIQIGGENTRNVTLASLRGAIALVSQDVILFDDTIAANIEYGRPGASQAEIEAAAAGAAAHEFIQALPLGYETMVGEHGVRLSGGQRQRLAIARAMLKNAPILLLDEPTSALDSESEQKVQNALQTLMHGRTTLIIAHRLATVTRADIIYVIDQGQVVAAGTHAHLQKTSVHYAKLCAAQFNLHELRAS